MFTQNTFLQNPGLSYSPSSQAAGRHSEYSTLRDNNGRDFGEFGGAGSEFSHAKAAHLFRLPLRRLHTVDVFVVARLPFEIAIVVPVARRGVAHLRTGMHPRHAFRLQLDRTTEPPLRPATDPVARQTLELSHGAQHSLGRDPAPEFHRKLVARKGIFRFSPPLPLDICTPRACDRKIFSATKKQKNL